MRIGIVSPGHPRSPKIWSGTTAHMVAALERHCGEVVPLGPVWGVHDTWGRVRSRVSRMLTGRIVPYRQSLSLSREQARLIGRRLRRAGPLDLLYAPASSEQLAFLRTEIPVVYTSDTTFGLIHAYYDDFHVPGPAGVAAGHEMERRALGRAARILYPSPWPVRSAVDDYGADPARIRVYPYGANVDRVPARGVALAPKPDGPLTLAWIGVDWARKGGPIAVETVRLLRGSGVDARLRIVGCAPAEAMGVDGVEVVGRLDKGDPGQAARFERILLESHFLFLPTRADCYGMVFCEAAGHGTPSVATDTGGVLGAVHEGVNGHLLPLEAGPADYAALLRRLHADAAAYRALCISARDLYDRALNWDAWGRTTREIMDEVVAERTVRA